MDPYPGVESDCSVSGEQRWGGATSIQFGKRSLQPATYQLETLVSASLLRAPWLLPREKRRDDASDRMRRPPQGLVWMCSRSEEKLELPGNRSVVASDLYVTFVYNGIFFKQCR